MGTGHVSFGPGARQAACGSGVPPHILWIRNGVTRRPRVERVTGDSPERGDGG